MRRLCFTIVLLAAPRAVLACPVCFGQSDSPLAEGTNMAIFFMLGVTGAVLAGFASFIVYLMRRANLVERLGTAEKLQAPPGDYLLDEKGSA